MHYLLEMPLKLTRARIDEQLLIDRHRSDDFAAYYRGMPNDIRGAALHSILLLRGWTTMQCTECRLDNDFRRVSVSEMAVVWSLSRAFLIDRMGRGETDQL